jgi:GDP-4-dehydro-6-deoxy-D-mannose reductase
VSTPDRASHRPESTPRAQSFLITGANGFAGGHLLQAIAESRAGSGLPVRVSGIGLGSLAVNPPVPFEYHDGDITDFEFVRRVVAGAQPNRVIHLAALTFGRPEGPADQRFLAVNVQGTRILCEALLAERCRARLLVASSSAVYGAAADDPITEETPIRPQTLYAASKACQEIVARTFGVAGDIEIVVTRAFNHTGPGEHPHFASSTFARQIAAAELGRAEPVVRVGNLESYRDFTDVRDIVRAYLAAIEQGVAGDTYNVCSGRATRMGEVLAILAGLARVPVTSAVDPSRLASADVPYQRGSHARLTAATGWQPTIPLATSLANLLDYWRVRVAEEAAAPADR